MRAAEAMREPCVRAGVDDRRTAPRTGAEPEREIEASLQRCRIGGRLRVLPRDRGIRVGDHSQQGGPRVTRAGMRTLVVFLDHCLTPRLRGIVNAPARHLTDGTKDSRSSPINGA